MKYFFIDTGVDEYKLHDSDGKVFFILKKKFGYNFHSCLYEYEPIATELKSWIIHQEDNFLVPFSYDKIILPMFRDKKLEKLLNG